MCTDGLVVYRPQSQKPIGIDVIVLILLEFRYLEEKL
jgi:hypothetical protein